MHIMMITADRWMFAGFAENITDFGTLKTGRVKMADPNCSKCAIESEVRKDDEALIRQMLEALETCDESDGYTGLRQFFDDKAVEAAITARPTGGACPQCRGSD